MDATATSGAEIGKGFQKVGGTASALGIEFEKVASWISIISSKTRESAESIGTSVNAMLSRISRITQTGFNEDDDTKLNDVAKALNTVDIALTDQTGNFRDFGTILDEIAVKWNTLDDQTQAYIANTVGGVRQQSKFFNLMNGYAESMDLYEQSLEAAGTAQSKFNLYLESNQATLDNFRTTLEGLWISVVDSDSLMSIVKAGTSFIELLDGMVQKFGTLNSALLVIIPLVGVKLAWAFRSAYVEVVKLIATGASKEVLATGGIFTKWAVSLAGVGTAASGATVGMTGLTLATAGLTLGIGLLVAGVMWWANESKKAKEAFADALDNSQKLNDEVESLNNLIKKQEELIAIENKSVEQKEELIKVQRELAQMYPELATGIDEEGNKIAENLEMTKQLTEEKRKLLEQELLVIKTTADTRLPQLRQELADMQDEAQRIQDRLTSGDVYETSWVEGYESQIDVTEDLKNRLLELVDAQKENHEETTKLESGVNSYNQILEENAERHKWARAEEIASQDVREMTTDQVMRMQDELIALGFTSEDATQIMSGNIDHVKQKYAELDMALILSLQTVGDLDAGQHAMHLNYLNNSRQTTEAIKADVQARIRMYAAELKALSALTGGKSKSVLTRRKIDEPVSIMSKKLTPSEMMRESGGSLLETKALMARDNLIDANNEMFKINSELRAIDKALANVNSITPGGGGGLSPPKRVPSSGSGGGGKGSGSSGGTTKDQYKAEADAYAKISLELDRNNNLLQLNKTYQDQAGDDIEKKLKLIKEEVGLQEDRQKLLNQLNEQRREEARKLQKDLSGIFNFEGSWDDNTMTITNLEAIEGKGKDIEDKFKRVLEIIKELPGASQEWMTILGIIKDTLLEEVELTIEQFVRGYKNINLELDENSNKLAEIKHLQDLATDGTAEHLSLIEQENEVYKERQGITSSLIEAKRQEVEEMQRLISELSKGKAQFSGTGDSLRISNMDSIQYKNPALDKAIEQFNQLQIKDIPGLKQQWDGYQLSVVNNLKKIEAEIQSHIDQLKALEEELDNFDLSGKIAELNKQLDAAKFNHWIESLILGLERFNDKTELLTFKLGLFDEEDYDNRADVVADLYSASKDKLEAYRQEWDKLSRQTPRNADEANQIAGAMKQVQQGMREAFVATREYQRELERIQFNAISNEFEKANKQIELQLSILDHNLGSLQDGILPDFSLEMVMPIPDFTDIFNETASENEKIYNEQVAFEEQIQDLKRQSLAMQLAESEEFYASERAKVEEHYNDLINKISEKMQEISELKMFANSGQMEELKKFFKDTNEKLEKNHKVVEEKTQEHNDKIEEDKVEHYVQLLEDMGYEWHDPEKEILDEHFVSVMDITTEFLNGLASEYESTWSSVVSTVRDSVSEILSAVSQAKSAMSSLSDSQGGSSGGSGKGSSGDYSGAINDQVMKQREKDKWNNRVNRYKDGTTGHPGGLAVVKLSHTIKKLIEKISG